MVDLDGAAIADAEFQTGTDLTNSSEIVLTIELDGDTDAIPSSTHILAGDVSGTSASLTIAHSSALGSDYSSSGGSYILATPTTSVTTDENSGIWFLNPPATTFTMSYTGLEPLSNNSHYEGWAIVDGVPVSTGKFNVDSNGDLVDLDGTVIDQGIFTVGGDLSTASAVVLSIEPAGDVDTTPSSTEILGGDIASGAANLDVMHGSSLGDDFSSAAGSYILATPTNGDSTNENSGIWWLDPTGGSPVSGLTLPTLPAGWNYEGWVVIDGTPVTTGTFLSC